MDSDTCVINLGVNFDSYDAPARDITSDLLNLILIRDKYGHTVMSGNKDSPPLTT